MEKKLIIILGSLLLFAGCNPQLAKPRQECVPKFGDSVIATYWAKMGALKKDIARRQARTLIGLLLKYQKSGDVNVTDENGVSLLLSATLLGELDLMRDILKPPFFADVNLPKNDGVTPLMIAAINENDAALRILLSAGASVNLQDNKGMTALMYAVINGSVSATTTLIENGADAMIKNHEGKTAKDFGGVASDIQKALSK